jgi:hypothetical protein
LITGRRARLIGALLFAVQWSTSAVPALLLCDHAPAVTATQQDRLLRMAAIVRDELERSGHRVALISRSGLNLQRFGIRYSHAGVSLQGSANTPWSVRQLYFSCAERRPRIFDQGIAGFLMGTDDPERGFVSIVLLPEPDATRLERIALDDAAAASLLNPDYSANAYAFGSRYQNCNQWLAELLAGAWRGAAAKPTRTDAQQWLIDAGYQPTDIDVGPLLMWAGAVMPWVHNDDHPRADLERNRYRVSLPAAIEQFVLRRTPQAERIEICHAEGRVVVHRGWDEIADGCVAAAGDRVIELN